MRLMMLAVLIVLVASRADAKSCGLPTTGEPIRCTPYGDAKIFSPIGTVLGPPECAEGVLCGTVCIVKGAVCHLATVRAVRPLDTRMPPLVTWRAPVLGEGAR